MAASILTIRPDRSATVLCSVRRISGEDAGAGVGGGGEPSFTGGTPCGGRLLGAAGLPGGWEVALGVGRDIGGRAISFPVACLNKASISACGNTLPPSLIICSRYHTSFEAHTIETEVKEAFRLKIPKHQYSTTSVTSLC